MLKQDHAIDLAFRALGDPTRRAIVERLSRGAASVSDIAAPFAMSLPAVHQHLQILAESGVMNWEKQGRTRVCSLNPAAIDRIGHWLNDRRRLWTRRFDALERHLASDSAPEPKRKGKAR